MNLSIEQLRDAYRRSANKDATLEALAASEGVSVSTIKLYVRGVMSSVELEDMAVTNGRVEAIIPAAVIPEEKPVQVITDAFVPIAKKKLGRPAKKHDEVKTVKKAAKTVIKVPEIVNAGPDPVVDEPKVAPSFINNGGMFFADVCDNTTPRRKPAIINQDFEAAVKPMFESAKAAIEEIPEDIKREMFSNPETPCTERADYVIGREEDPTIPIKEVEAQPKATTHILKCQQPYFNDIWEGYKPFEVRLNDREYESGDSVLLIAYNTEHSIFETRQIFADIGYILSGKSFPSLLDEEAVVFSLINIKRYELQEVTVHDQNE